MSNRRFFLKSLAALTAGICAPIDLKAGHSGEDRLGKLLPLRQLGRTGDYVTMLGVGGYHVGWTTERDAQEVIEAALEGGVRFFDTAVSYGPFISEERYGKFLTPKHRDIVYLMTKSHAREAKDMQQHLDDSLRRMKTDYIDLWQIHALGTPQDADNRIANGILEVLIKAKESGKVRHLGFTGHQNPFGLERMLEQTTESKLFDAIQMPVNVCDESYFSFTKLLMPELMNRGIAVLAMKTLADGRFFSRKAEANWTTDDPLIPNHLSMKEALYYAWSLPISVLITGAENATYMREKIELARNFAKMDEDQRLALVERVREIASTGQLEYYKRKET